MAKSYACSLVKQTIVCALIMCVAAGATPLAAPTPQTQPQLGAHLKPCTVGKSKASALCGTFGVYEDRQSGSGRIIQLGVSVLKAKQSNDTAIAFIEGGPGVAAVPDAGPIADGGVPVLKPFLNTYDVLFVDNRGMGVSNPTKCNISPYTNMPAYFLQIWPDRILTDCYNRYTATSDASAYNTNNAVDDLDDVRAALGYRKLILYGGSYGSFFSFVYVRRHESSVANAVLLGIAAPHFVPLPGAPQGAQVALDDLMVKCAHDPVCKAHFSKFKEHFAAVLKRFQNGPVSMKVWNPSTKRLIHVRLSKEVFVDRVREALYEPGLAAFLPYVIERAYHLDYVPLGKIVDAWSQFLAQGQDAGTNLAYRCADLDPFISNSQLEEQAAHSFTGDLRVRAERHACDIWKVDPMPASFDDPVSSTVPILMLQGLDDPATPPESAEKAVATLPNAKLLLVRGAGHGVFTPCATSVQIQFIKAGNGNGIATTTCSGSFKTPPFETSMKNF